MRSSWQCRLYLIGSGDGVSVGAQLQVAGRLVEQRALQHLPCGRLDFVLVLREVLRLLRQVRRRLQDLGIRV